MKPRKKIELVILAAVIALCVYAIRVKGNDEIKYNNIDPNNIEYNVIHKFDYHNSIVLKDTKGYYFISFPDEIFKEYKVGNTMILNLGNPFEYYLHINNNNEVILKYEIKDKLMDNTLKVFNPIDFNSYLLEVDSAIYNTYSVGDSIYIAKSMQWLNNAIDDYNNNK